MSIDTCNNYDLSYKTSNNKRLHIEIALMQLSKIYIDKATPEPKKALSTESKTINEEIEAYRRSDQPKTEVHKTHTLC